MGQAEYHDAIGSAQRIVCIPIILTPEANWRRIRKVQQSERTRS